jgi:hypothetical protein
VILPPLVFPAIELHMGSDGSTVVELSPHYPKVEGSSPSVDTEYSKKGCLPESKLVEKHASLLCNEEKKVIVLNKLTMLQQRPME